MDTRSPDKHAAVTADDFALDNGLRLNFDNLSNGHEPQQQRQQQQHQHNSSAATTSAADSSGNNAADGTRKHKTIRRRKGPRAQSIEEIFATISAVRTSGLNPPPEHIVLTPRSAEACLRCGVNPETLKIRDLESFYDGDVAPAVQRMRHEAYSMRRHEEMKAVRTEKNKIIEAEDAAETQSHHRHRSPHSASAASKKHVTLASSAHSSPERSDTKLSLVDVERRRLEKVKQRQEREIEQMLDFEMKMNELQQAAAAKVERERRLHEQRERERVRFAQELAEAKRQRELEKKAQLDAEEERRKLLAAAMAQRDRELAAHKAEQDKLRRLEARDRDEERKARAEEHRLATEALARQQQLEVAERLRELDVAEKARHDMVEQQRAERVQQLEDRRRVVTQRIRTNLQQSKRLERQRKRELVRKQAASDQLRRDHEAEVERQRAVARQQQELLERKRQLVLDDARREDERKTQALLQRQRDVERSVEQLQATQTQQLELKREYRRIQQQLKLDKVERMQRVQEYKRLETLRKLQETEQRTQAMLSEKEALVQRRKQVAVTAKIQRDVIVRTMEQVKITKKWHAASKTIEQALGKAAGAGIAAPLSRSPSPTKSIGGGVHSSRPKSNTGALARQTSLPTIARPHTPSGSSNTGAQSRVFRPSSPPPTRTAFKFTREAQEQAAAAGDGVGPQTYCSPYDQVGTKFLQELSVGDAILIQHPTSLVEETRIVRMVLSDISAAISSAFSSDLVSSTAFHYIKAPPDDTPKDDDETSKKRTRKTDEAIAFGTYAGGTEVGSQFTYRVKKSGAYGGYAIVKENANVDRSREDLLDLRSKRKGDRHCM